jgi:anthranilate phosphoribosyltransferase
MKEYIEKCLARQDLSVSEAADALERIMSGNATDVQIAGLLIALRAKGEAESEVVGFARTMRAHAVRVRPEDPDAIDMCGTGGDGRDTFNISTVAAIVASGAGVTVAKHGNRSVSSRSGSADVLTALGVKVQLPPDKVEACLNTVGIGFLFAPLFHPAMKFAARPRQELGVRTIFNMLGPITNPAGVRRQVLGTYHHDVAHRLAGALRVLDTDLACVIHSDDGMDEVSLAKPTSVHEVGGMQPVRRYTVDASDFGLTAMTPDAVRGGDPEANARIALSILQAEPVPGRDIVLANAGLGIFVSGKAPDLVTGARMAAEAIDSGRALAKLRLLVEYTNKA